MIDALYNGRSGLKSYERSLNVDTNNIANVNTLAYKADRVSFEDLMYQNREGKGVTIGSIDKSFKQGELKSTGNVYDMAVKGPGFFIVRGNNPELFYTRAGNFRMGADGFLQNPEGLKVQGLVVTEPEVFSSNPDDKMFTDKHAKNVSSVNISNENLIMAINAKITNFEQTAKPDSLDMSGKGFKTAGSKIADVSILMDEYQRLLRQYNTNPVEGEASETLSGSLQINMANMNGRQDFIEVNINGKNIRQDFTESGPKTLNMFVDKINEIQGISATLDEVTGKLTITSLVPGKNIEITDGQMNDEGLPFTVETPAKQGTGLLALNSARDALAAVTKRAGGDFMEIRSRLDLDTAGIETLGGLQMNLKSLNLSENPFGTPEVIDGIVYMNQGNNKFIVGKIETVDFREKESLDPKGGNLFGQSLNSGNPVLNTKTAEILTGTLELSNADLSESLTNMMVNQRAFEANSKSLTTADEFLNIAIGLKK